MGYLDSVNGCHKSPMYTGIHTNIDTMTFLSIWRY